MIETKIKYNFKENIIKIEKYLEENDFDNIDIQKINKILFNLRNIDVIIENIDEELISDDIDNDYNNFDSYCSSFLHGNIHYISNMLTASDSIIKKLLKYVDYNMILSNKSNIKKYIKNYKFEITKQSNNLKEEVSAISDYIKQQKSNIENENTELNNKIQEINNKLDNLNNEQIALNNNMNELIEKSKENIDELKDNSKSELMNHFNELSEEYKGKFEELLKKIHKKDEKISNLIGIVGEKARIGEYKKNADMSRIERIIWQFITIILFLIAFGLMLYVTITSEEYNKFTVFKYIVSAILMGATTYTAKQASNSRKDEVYYRKQELELASIDVYLENMNPENREEIKKNLSTKMFGQAQNTYTNKYDDKKDFTVDDLVKIIEVIKNKIQ